MRRVFIQGTPPQDWIDKAEAATTKLRLATTPEERQVIIEQNKNLWTDDRIRNWLLKQFSNKCWYSEAHDTVAPYHVDHYRPKGRAKDLEGNACDGYWWLAFAWQNYRICGQLINVKKLDVFPIVEGARATCDDAVSLQLEAPLLIDPTTEQARLISYEKEDDSCIAVSAGGADGSDKVRADQTIEILGLNRRDRLTQKRTDYWDKCLQAIADYNGAEGPQVLKVVMQAAAVTRIRQMVGYQAEFSSVAEACLRKKGTEALNAQVFDIVPEH
jgi:hypothetical protein